MLTENNVEVWVKPLRSTSGKTEAIAILNRGNDDTVFKLNSKKLGISKNRRIRDLWLHKDLGKIGSEQTFTIPKHGIMVLKVS